MTRIKKEEKMSYHFRGKRGFDFTIFQILPIDGPEETVMLNCFLSTMFSHTAKSLLYILVQKLVRDNISYLFNYSKVGIG